MKRKTVKVILSVLLCLGIAVFPLNVLAEGTEENVQEQPDETTEAAAMNETAEVVEAAETVETAEAVEVILNDDTGIPDVNFYQAVLENYDENEDGELTTNEVENILSLTLVSKNIENIQGIQYFRNLKSLCLSGNKISDISPLEGIPLTFLQLRGNNIADISALKGMPLAYLDLGNNDITDISALEGMELVNLCLDCNNITDISVLEGLPIENLWLYNNYNLTDINALSGMPLRNLQLSNTGVSDLSALQGMELELLYVASNVVRDKISDISVLKGMPLKSLDISGNNISDLSALEDMELTTLKICDNNISSLDSLKNSRLMEYIGEYASTDNSQLALYYGENFIKEIEIARGNRISKENALEVLPEELLNYKVAMWNSETNSYEKTEVTWLETENFIEENVQEQPAETAEVIPNDETGIPDVNFYQAVLEAGDSNSDGVLTNTEAEKITYLNLQSRNIENIQGIQYFTNLICLDLSHNQIEDISALKGVYCRTMWLSDNRIKDIEALEGNCIVTLDISNNQVENISVIDSFDGYDPGEGLAVLKISNNFVSDISALKSCEKLVTVWMENNPITDITPLTELEDIASIKFDDSQIQDLAILSRWASWASLEKDVVIVQRFFSGNEKIAPSIYSYYFGTSVASGYTCTQPELKGYEPFSEEGYVTVMETAASGETKYIDFYYNKDSTPASAKVILNDETGIPDVNFYQAVLSSYDANKNGVLTTNEVENVTSLTLTYKKIKNIQGIQYFTSLKELNLSDNQITDCSPLKGMALDSLNLSNNQIADISPIKEIEVKNLNLSYNQIEDATPLTGMALEELYVSNNRISDITPLCSLTQIKGLSITFNNISDLSPLKGSPLWKRLQEYAIATQDTFELDYYIGTVSHIRKIAISGGNPLTREQVMEALPEELIYYTAGKKHPFRDEMVATGRTWMDSEIFLDEVIKNDETGIPDPNLYQVLLEAGDANQDGVLTSEEAGHISEVNASNKGITDLTGLVYLRGIVEKLDLRENNISDLTPLAKGPYMVDYLYLDHNNISDITPLSNRAIPMWAIRLSYNNISDTTPLKDLLVEELYLDHNKISSIESMSEIVDSHYCKVLDLSDNNITDISPLAGSVGIQKLTLSNNKIQNLDVLEKLIYITTLRVDGNPITDISPIGTLNYLYLRDLRLDETQIPDLAELKNYNNLDNKCVYAERFFDENGNTQIANTIYNFRSGSSYTSKQPEIEGYEPASEEGYVTYKGTLTEDITYVDFYYNKVSEPDSETKPETEADGDYIVDITGNDTEIKKEDFEKIINENASRDVIFKSNVEITIRFAKGTMKEVDGKVSYDMGAEMTRDFDKLDGKVQKIIDKKNLVSYVSYHYSGELPSEAEIQINVGIEWTGKTLYYYYYDVKKGILELIQEAVVNPEGIMTVRQNHCSDYVILSEKTADAVSENETQQESTKEAEDEQDEQEDEQQAIHSADSAVNTKDAAPTAWLFLLSVISGTVLIAFAAGDKKRYQ